MPLWGTHEGEGSPADVGAVVDVGLIVELVEGELLGRAALQWVDDGVERVRSIAGTTVALELVEWLVCDEVHPVRLLAAAEADVPHLTVQVVAR